MFKRFIRAGCVALLLAALCVAASAETTPTAETTATAETTTTAETTLSPTTGLPTDKPYRPVLVQISNATDARPPWGLSQADIVYEAVIWAPHHTRYLALYNDHHPEKVGSIRGSRVFFCELREAWDCPIVLGGGQGEEGTSIFDFIDEREVPAAFIFDYTASRGVWMEGFSRDGARVSPHNSVFNLAKMVESVWPQQDGVPYEPRLPGLVFDSEPMKGDVPATQITVQYDQLDEELTNLLDSPFRYDSYTAGYTFNSEARLYERVYNGEPQTDYEGESIVAANVIVQEIPLSFFADYASRPVMDTTGEGKIDAFIDGMHISGTWKREALDDQTQFLDANGEALRLLPGKTYIQIVPVGFAVEYQ